MCLHNIQLYYTWKFGRWNLGHLVYWIYRHMGARIYLSRHNIPTFRFCCKSRGSVTSLSFRWIKCTQCFNIRPQARAKTTRISQTNTGTIAQQECIFLDLHSFSWLLNQWKLFSKNWEVVKSSSNIGCNKGVLFLGKDLWVHFFFRSYELWFLKTIFPSLKVSTGTSIGVYLYPGQCFLKIFRFTYYLPLPLEDLHLCIYSSFNMWTCAFSRFRNLSF